MMTIMTNS